MTAKQFIQTYCDLVRRVREQVIALLLIAVYLKRETGCAGPKVKIGIFCNTKPKKVIKYYLFLHVF